MRRRRESLAERRIRRAAVDEPQVVLDAALRFLEARQRSTTEVRRRLTTTGYRDELIDGAIARLTELGMLDDEAFARAWLESRDRARPRGERALRRELAIKGLDREIVDEAIEERDVERPDADAEAARRLLDRHARALGRLDDPARRRERAYALLARNGFDPEVAARLAREI